MGVDVSAEVQKRPIPGYEGIYEAGDDGEIYSVARYCACGPGMQGKRFVRSRKLKKNMQRFRLGGYQVKVSLYKDTKLSSMKVKQLVAMAWLGWTDGPILLADGDHMNTRPDNLRPVSSGEWHD